MATSNTTLKKIPYLITGATGNLGAAVVATLLKSVDASSITISSSSASNADVPAQKFPGTNFSHADYDDPATLHAAFQGVQKLFFVSSNVPNDPNRLLLQHKNVVDAAKAAGVEHTYYTSQAFGGYGTASPSNVLQTPHLATENFLKESRIPYTALRCSIYAEAFARILSWSPTNPSLLLPAFLRHSGPIAYVSRAELGEAIGNLIASPSPPDFSSTGNIALLTGPNAPTFSEVIAAVEQAWGSCGNEKQIEVEWVDNEWPERMAEVKKGVPKMVWEFHLGIYKCIAKGEIGMVGPLMGELLGRRPRGGTEIITEVVQRMANEADSA